MTPAQQRCLEIEIGELIRRDKMPTPRGLVKIQRRAQPDYEAFVWGMYLLWASRPSKRTSEPDGSYFIGEVGEAPKKNWERLNPYAVATPK